jgi:hypothetical protein
MRPALLAALLLAACSNKIDAKLDLDGQPFQAASCRSGQASGFAGVDLVASDGRKLRLVADPSGKAAVFVFAAGGAVGADLGLCGLFSLERQSSTINQITNVKGSATLDCATDGHKLTGSVKFENCH